MAGCALIGESVRIARRTLLIATLAATTASVAEPVTRSMLAAIAGAAKAARPTPSGTTATRCAQCGSADHTMLDARCPLAPRVLG